MAVKETPMDAAQAFLNGAGTQRPKSRRAAQRLLTLINALCGTLPAGYPALVPAVAPKAVRRGGKPRG
jgi:hypothetical protein